MKNWHDMSIKTLAARIRSGLVANQNKAAALANQISHKESGYRAYGIAVPVVNQIARDFFPEVKGLTWRDLKTLAELLYQEKQSESKLLANTFLQKRIKEFSRADLKWLNRMTAYLDNWSCVDDFCIDVLHPLLFVHTDAVVTLLRRWNRSKSIWRQRISLVALTRKIGKTGRFTKLAFEFSDRLLNSDKDIVLKAVGWMLKEPQVLRGLCFRMPCVT